MKTAQPGILADVPKGARYLTFRLAPGADPRAALGELAGVADGMQAVVGLGRSTIATLGRSIDGLEELTPFSLPGVEVPSTPAALWVWLRGDDRGVLVHRARRVEAVVKNAFELVSVVDAFKHGSGRDLSGYEDGTENPQGEDIVPAALVTKKGKGLEGSSFVAVQQWVHDFGRFDRMSPGEQDATIGRKKRGNEEIEDAPASAHVKRTAQESFKPEAFVWRRSMPWADGQRAGLMFVAFGRSLYAFNAQMRRMAGAEDGIADALFRFTKPISGSAFWCPPMKDGRLDLSAIGLVE